MKLLQDYLLIEVDKAKEKTESGLVLPEQIDQEPPGKGTIKFLSEDCFLVKEGDVVLFPKYGPAEVDIEKKKYLLVHEKDIIAIL